MDTNLDLGKNSLRLIEKLAAQIGTTTENIFPWFVKQSLIEGYLFFIIIFISLLLGSFLFLFNYKKAEYNLDNYNLDINHNGILTIIGIFIVTVDIIVLFFASTWAISAIFNPNFQAMVEITRMIGRMK